MATKKVNDNLANDIVDISIAPKTKKRFRIDKDNNKIIELDISDINMVPRLDEMIPKLETITDEYTDVDVDDEEDGINAEAKLAALRDAEKKMREAIDYIFDSNVCDIICGNTSIFSPINGKFKFEYILATLTGLYEENMKVEAGKLQAQISKHTAKYHN